MLRLCEQWTNQLGETFHRTTTLVKTMRRVDDTTEFLPFPAVNNDGLDGMLKISEAEQTTAYR